MNQIKLIENTYRNSKVFLTGHTGFKGSWLTILLNELGAKVKGYSLPPENKNDIYNSIHFDSIQSVIADIRDRKKLEDEIIEFQPDFIFHLAAQPLVRLSYQIPSETFEINVIGTANLLSAVKKLDKKCQVICITTDKVYHNNEWIYPYRETDELGGYDPYSASKAASEIVISSYKNSFFNLKDYQIHKKAVASVRAGNVIGGGDWSKDRLIPDIIKSISSNNEIVVRNPNAVRPWQHVLEPIFGYLLLGSKMVNEPVKHSTAYNFGPSNSDNLTVREILEIAINSYGSGTYTIKEEENQLHEANLLRLDISKVSNELNWKPKFSANQAVDLTIQWYKNFNNGISAVELVKNDIQKYINY
ncbi:MAG: CDP-glucose 4,6-dehydratase [Flavobacteriales bacterium]|nr:CDP-glucose 4,6-dehydratase [Flavobacteriales bacterium]